MKESGPDDATFWVYEKTVLGRLLEGFGWALGWGCYWLARAGLTRLADHWVDLAIILSRSNRGAIRTLGYLSGQRGRLAIRRGWVLVEGQIGPGGPFANKRFIARYDVAARDEASALSLIRRWEWDAVPESLRIEEAHLEWEDSGAEGILWAYPGRAFFQATDEAEKS